MCPRGDTGPDADPLRPCGDCGQRDERLPLDLHVPDALEAGVLGSHREVDDLLERHAVAAQQEADVRRAGCVHRPSLRGWQSQVARSISAKLNPNSARRT